MTSHFAQHFAQSVHWAIPDSRLPHFHTPYLQNIQNASSKCVTPLPLSHSHFPFFHRTLRNNWRKFANMSNSKWLILRQNISNDSTSVLQYSWLQTGVIMTAGNKNLKIYRSFLLPQLVQNINISISSDEHVYTQKIFRSSGRSSFHFRHLNFEPSGSAVAPNSVVPSDFQFKELPCPQNFKKLSVVRYGYFLETPINL